VVIPVAREREFYIAVWRLARTLVGLA
jgi:hypothetical protein